MYGNFAIHIFNERHFCFATFVILASLLVGCAGSEINVQGQDASLTEIDQTGSKNYLELDLVALAKGSSPSNGYSNTNDSQSSTRSGDISLIRNNIAGDDEGVGSIDNPFKFGNEYTITPSINGFTPGMIVLVASFNLACTDFISCLESNNSVFLNDFSGVQFRNLVATDSIMNIVAAASDSSTGAIIESSVDVIYLESDQSAPGSGFMNWRPLAFDIVGTDLCEDDGSGDNPFLDYRYDLEVTGPSGQSYTVPGFYAGNGNAQEDGEGTRSCGNIWRAYVLPDEAGDWTANATLIKGPDIAVNRDSQNFTQINGRSFQFTVDDLAFDDGDLRNKGPLRKLAGSSKRVFAGSGDYYLKVGMDSPENLLAYADFDSTPGRHHFTAHLNDYDVSSDVCTTWHGASHKGQSLFGAIKYLNSQNVNGVSFLTLNESGDGDDVWPFLNEGLNLRHFDVSKLAQWELVWDCMDKYDIFFEIKFQEEEIDHQIDNGNYGVIRKLYLREMVARTHFHRGVTYNMGEEYSRCVGANHDLTNTQKNRRANCVLEEVAEVAALDPSNHRRVVHFFPDDSNLEVYYTIAQLDSQNLFDGVSYQSPGAAPAEFHSFLTDIQSVTGHRWINSADEFGGGAIGVDEYTSMSAIDNRARDMMYRIVAPILFTNGEGSQAYSGYDFNLDDLNLDNFKRREGWYAYMNHATRFFTENVPNLPAMRSADSLTNKSDDYVIADPNSDAEVFAAVFARKSYSGFSIDLPLAGVDYEVLFYDLEAGQFLANETITIRQNSSTFDLPAGDRHWHLLIRKASS